MCYLLAQDLKINASGGGFGKQLNISLLVTIMSIIQNVTAKKTLNAINVIKCNKFHYNICSNVR